MTEIIDMTRAEVSAAMDAERQATLDDLLSRWHHWLHPIGSSRGFGSRAAGTALYRSSRQRDDENGALDAEIEHRIMCGVAVCHEKLVDPYRSAISIEARNLHLGYAVYQSPRLPIDPEAREVIRKEARRLMIRGLRGAGLME